MSVPSKFRTVMKSRKHRYINTKQQVVSQRCERSPLLCRSIIEEKLSGVEQSRECGEKSCQTNMTRLVTRETETRLFLRHFCPISTACMKEAIGRYVWHSIKLGKSESRRDRIKKFVPPVLLSLSLLRWHHVPSTAGLLSTSSIITRALSSIGRAFLETVVDCQPLK